MTRILDHALRVGASRLGHPQLIYAHYGVTHRCNMRCRMCDVWKSGAPELELTVSQASLLAENLHRAGAINVALGGGEPFVRKDLSELVFSFSKRSLEVRVLTNGIGVREQRIREVIDAGLQHVSISLDTLDPVKQSYIYNGVDVWADIVQAMRRFRAWLPERSAPVVNVCVSRINIDELDKIVDFAAGEGFLCSFVPIALSSSSEQADGFAAVAPDLAFGPDDQDRITTAYDKLLERKLGGAPIANSSRFLRDSKTHLLDSTHPWHCDAGTLYLSVSPEGNISICHHFPAFARFDTPDLKSLLRNPDLRREFAAQRSSCDGCMRPCWTEVTHAVHDLFAGLEAVLSMRTAARMTRGKS